jgi:hypothetical protein
MNLNAKLLFIATVVATCPLQAELLRDAQGVWKITPTKPTDLPTDPEKNVAGAALLALMEEYTANSSNEKLQNANSEKIDFSKIGFEVKINKFI